MERRDPIYEDELPTSRHGIEPGATNWTHLVPDEQWEEVDLHTGGALQRIPFISPGQEPIDGKVHFVGKGFHEGEIFIGPVIDEKGLLKCPPGGGDPYQNALKTYEILVADPAKVHWAPIGENRKLQSGENEFVIGTSKLYIGRHKDVGIGVVRVRLDNGAYELFSYERSLPYEKFEVLCVSPNPKRGKYKIPFYKKIFC